MTIPEFQHTLDLPLHKLITSQNFSYSLIFLYPTTMFDPRNQNSNDHKAILDPVNSNTWEVGTKTPQNLRNNDVVGVQFRVQNMSHHIDESGISSPPLWKNSLPRNTRSPSARAVAIAKGQWELMEMVKNMPESSYELSLKDLVEKQEECLINKEDYSASPDQQVIQRQESIKNKSIDQKKGKMIRSESIENRKVFLKMSFPISFESRKKKKNLPKTSRTKVSPKPEGSENKASKSFEKDWWKRRFSCSSESGSSSNSESTNTSGSRGSNESRTRKKQGFLGSFWSSFCISKSKHAD